MKLKKTLLLVLIPIMFLSCVTFQPVQIRRTASLDGYTYFYITPTETKTGLSGGVYGGNNGVYGSSISKSTNPADILSGFLIKRGLIRLPEIKNDLAEVTGEGQGETEADDIRIAINRCLEELYK